MPWPCFIIKLRNCSVMQLILITEIWRSLVTQTLLHQPSYLDGPSPWLCHGPTTPLRTEFRDSSGLETPTGEIISTVFFIMAIQRFWRNICICLVKMSTILNATRIFQAKAGTLRPTFRSEGPAEGISQDFPSCSV